MDRFEAMAIFVEVVDCGSMSAAARKLAMPVPTLSRKLSDLEDHLGTKLLTRSTRRLDLTDAGTAYLDACRRILDHVGEAEREVSGEYLAPRGELVLTAPLAFGRRHVMPVVSEFLAQHPEINVRLGLSDYRIDLVSEHVDLAVRIGPPRDSSLVAARIGAIRWAVIASPDFLAAHGTPRTPEDLARLPCIGVDFNNLDTLWRFRKPGQDEDYRIPITSRLAVTTAEGAIEAVLAGVGISQVLRYQTAPHLEEGRLRTVLDDLEATPMTLAVMYTGGGRMPLKTRSFLDFAVPRLRARMSNC